MRKFPPRYYYPKDIYDAPIEGPVENPSLYDEYISAEEVDSMLTKKDKTIELLEEDLGRCGIVMEKDRLEIARLTKLGLELEEKPEIEANKPKKKAHKDKEFSHQSHHTECHWASCPGDCFERYGK